MYRSVARGRPLLAVARSAAVAMSVLVAGCGEDPREAERTEVGELRIRVAGVASTAAQHEPDAFQEAFAEGAAPPDSDRPKYAPPMMFELSGKPEISGSGDSATLTVKVFRRSDDPISVEKELLGEVEWEAVRVHGKWKLKAAPLPEGA